MSRDSEYEDIDIKQRSTFFPPVIVVSAWIVIILGTVTVGYVSYGILFSGHLLDDWENLSEAQGHILGQLITVYAAAFATIVAPAIFAGKFDSIENRIETIHDRLQTASRIESDTSLSGAGFKSLYEQKDLERSRELLRVMQVRTAEFAQLAKENSRRWKRKQEFKGMWPTRTNYIDQLKSFDMISEAQYCNFLTVIESRKFTHGKDLREIDLQSLNKVAMAFSQLEEVYADD